MTWESFYLICFLVGLMLSAVFAAGRDGAYWLAHSCAARAASSYAHPDAYWAWRAACWPRWRNGTRFGAGGGDRAVVERVLDHGVPVLVWGGRLPADTAWKLCGGRVLLLAVICGVAGGAIVFLFLTRVLLPHERELTADETSVVGVVGRVQRPFARKGLVKLCTNRWARAAPPRRAQRTERRFRKKKRCLSRVMKKESRTCGGGKKYLKSREQGLGNRD